MLMQCTDIPAIEALPLWLVHLKGVRLRPAHVTMTQNTLLLDSEQPINATELLHACSSYIKMKQIFIETKTTAAEAQPLYKFNDIKFIAPAKNRV